MLNTFKEFFYEVMVPFFIFCVFILVFVFSLIFSIQYLECKSLAKIYQIETFNTFPIGCFIKNEEGPIPIEKYEKKR